MPEGFGMPRVRCYINPAAVYLLLGVVVSVAVAWGFAAQFPWRYWAVEVGPKANAAGLDDPVPIWVLEAFDIPIANPDRYTRVDIVAFGFTSAEFEAWRSPPPPPHPSDEALVSLFGAPKPKDLHGMLGSHTFAYGWPWTTLVRYEYRY